jgi:quinohemoprotein ethanol dehydrogenase
MRNELTLRSTQFSFSILMSKCAIALLCCAFLIEPLFAQEVDWTANGNDLSNSRFQNIDQINPSNVSQRKQAWVFHTGAMDSPSYNPSSYFLEATPLVVNGVMYITDGMDDVFAVNPTTGKQIWKYTPSDLPPWSTFTYTTRANRGVAYGQGMVFIGRFDTMLVALNAKTGAVVWKTPVDSVSNWNFISAAPQFINASDGAGGTVPEVITSLSSDAGGRCHVDAYNATTGKLLWRFYTTDPATFAGNSWQVGGGAVWQTPTFDPTLNMVYFSVGNPTPPYTGNNRVGANLFTDSMVAIDATSGELQWFFQMVHHDLWDYDGTQPTMLFTLNGVPVIEGNTKAGYNFILDRASGESIFPYEEVAIPATPANAAFQHPWPTQPVSSIESLAELTVEPWSVPAGVVAAPSEWATEGPTVQMFQPNEDAGYEFPSAAYSPRTHMMYSHAEYWPIVSVTTDVSNCVPGLSFFGCGNTNGAQALGVNHGVYGAINTVTGKVAWSIPIISSIPESGMTVGGDLVFFGDSDGLFYAASAATGEILWVFDALTVPGAGGANATGPAVYEINGVEYVVNAFGGNAYCPSLLGDAVIAFALPSSVAAAAHKSAADKARVK